MALVAVGISGHAVSLRGFLLEQEVVLDPIDLSAQSILTMFAENIVTFIFTIVAVFALPYIKPWSLRFGLPTIFMVVALVVFMTGSLRSTDGPVGSPLTTLFRVLSASSSKFYVPRPASLHGFHGVLDYSVCVDDAPPLRCCRF
ncbi:hypothetical protein ACJIZ3_021310 [Penstemon smallii]|uniref:Uncharacterized protein n=1 Tax=Penstemon smallii TaxID=265156 RepID=A0ABD3SLP1_9LAMI